MANQTLENVLIHTFRSRSDPEYVDPSLVPLFFSEIGMAMYFNVALLTTLVYHAPTTMDREVKYFWVRLNSALYMRVPMTRMKGKPLSLTSLVYFINRYMGILGQVCSILRE
ncbi:uncharacterized protein FOMMEDRAFT_156699 [Fomitiporia mediterranea MF3/22]|uniref:uncharacterized protein n=1 Tax=Fomitiporia mediterranea (strain MF3/22) TaxID=694068 RepID=UPI000440731C|nr:uncharacterized protein FOMMEDRAFT_156699 [Fomitiporia mediterranea MF3/22]EJD03314.1 hypothetical protein FOMMEDRAFT_156699 [Fomitiporia mediterranea MF3/22]